MVNLTIYKAIHITSTVNIYGYPIIVSTSAFLLYILFQFENILMNYNPKFEGDIHKNMNTINDFIKVPYLIALFQYLIGLPINLFIRYASEKSLK